MLNSDYRVQGGSSNFPVLPEDDYQVVITDITEKESFKYQSQEKETQLVFTFLIPEGEHKARKVWYYCRPIFSPARTGKNPSKLFELLRAIYGYPAYEKDVSEMTSEDLNAETLNGLIRKQLIITIQEYTKQSGELGNKVAFVKKIKKEVEVDPNLMLTDEPDASKEPVKNAPVPTEGQGVSDDDIPF